MADQDKPLAIGYETAQTRRADRGRIPDGYLGHRSDPEDPSDGPMPLGTTGWIAVLLISLILIVVTFWVLLSLITWKD